MLEIGIAIRWRDMDAYSHVNNATYLTYLEECRDAWIHRVLGEVSNAWDFVLAHIAVDYRSELRQEDGQVTVRCRIAGVGRSSIRTREEIVKPDGTVSAEAESVIVPRDPELDRSRPLSHEERRLLEAELAADAAAASRRP
jgi:acyl-CoA thioester hydrolase